MRVVIVLPVVKHDPWEDFISAFSLKLEVTGHAYGLFSPLVCYE